MVPTSYRPVYIDLLDVSEWQHGTLRNGSASQFVTELKRPYKEYDCEEFCRWLHFLFSPGNAARELLEECLDDCYEALRYRALMPHAIMSPQDSKDAIARFSNIMTPPVPDSTFAICHRRCEHLLDVSMTDYEDCIWQCFSSFGGATMTTGDTGIVEVFRTPQLQAIRQQ